MVFARLRGLCAWIGIHRLPKREAGQIKWRDVDFEAGEIVVRGDPETGTKNWELRRVPMIPDARALFERMRSERPSEPLDAKVFRVRRMPEGARSRVQKGRHGSHHASRFAALVRNALHRIAAWTFQPSHAGSDTKTAARWQ